MRHPANVYSMDCRIGEDQLPVKEGGSQYPSCDSAALIPLVPAHGERGQRMAQPSLAV